MMRSEFKLGDRFIDPDGDGIAERTVTYSCTQDGEQFVGYWDHDQHIDVVFPASELTRTYSRPNSTCDHTSPRCKYNQEVGS